MKKEESHPIKFEGSPPPSLSNGIETPSPDKELELHYHLGIGYKEMGLFDYAISEFELASEDPLMKFDCYILLGECFKEKGDFEQSTKYLQFASKIKELPKDL
jgi:tetratricopeptide (TPR) repeat protein